MPWDLTQVPSKYRFRALLSHHLPHFLKVFQLYTIKQGNQFPAFMGSPFLWMAPQPHYIKNGTSFYLVSGPKLLVLMWQHLTHSMCSLHSIHTPNVYKSDCVCTPVCQSTCVNSRTLKNRSQIFIFMKFDIKEVYCHKRILHKERMWQLCVFQYGLYISNLIYLRG
jgi:hypothetical protein